MTDIQNSPYNTDNWPRLPKIAEGEIGQDLIQTINARELHKYLENGDQFTHWIKDRIRQYDFVENQDYVLVRENSQIKKRGGDRRSIDYHISLDMAKELAMVERNERGKEVRAYFIECERKFRSQMPQIDYDDPVHLRGFSRHLLLDNQKKAALIEEQTQQISKLDAILDRIYHIKDSLLLTDAAKTLEVKPHWLGQYLSDTKWFYKHKKAKHWTGFQDKIDKGYLVHKLKDYRDQYGNLHSHSQVRITPKGMIKLAEQINKIHGDT